MFFLYITCRFLIAAIQLILLQYFKQVKKKVVETGYYFRQ